MEDLYRKTKKTRRSKCMIESRPYHFLLPVHVLAINKVKHEMMALTGKLTCPLKIHGWKMYFLLNQSFFRGDILVFVGGVTKKTQLVTKASCT